MGPYLDSGVRLGFGLGRPGAILRADVLLAGPEAHALLAKFLPVLRTCHAAVPFSSSERYAVPRRPPSHTAYDLDGEISSSSAPSKYIPCSPKQS